MLGKPCSWSTFSQRWPHVPYFHGILPWQHYSKHLEGFLWVSFSSQKRTRIAVIHTGAGTFLSSSFSLNWLLLCLKCFHCFQDAKPNPFPFCFNTYNPAHKMHTFNENLLELMVFLKQSDSSFPNTVVL